MSIWYDMQKDSYGLRLFGRPNGYDNLDSFVAEVGKLANKIDFPKNVFLNICFYNSVSAVYIYPTTIEDIHTEHSLHVTLSFDSWQKVDDEDAEAFAIQELAKIKDIFESELADLRIEHKYSFFDWDDDEGLQIKLLSN